MHHGLTQHDASSGPATRGRARRRREGFTLIETALATIIIGLGVIAIMAAQQAFHKENTWSTHASTAARLGNEIRELTLNLPRHDPVTGLEFWGYEENEPTLGDFDDIDDFDGPYNGPGLGLVFDSADGSGPINSSRQVISNMDGWAQIVRVFNVDSFDIRFDPDDLSTLPADGSTDMVMVVVTVTYRGEEITTVTWIAPN